MSSELWQRIKAARLEAGLTQQQVGDALGITRSAVAQWESKNPEKRTSPSHANLKDLADIVKCPLHTLLQDSDMDPAWENAVNAIEDEPANITEGPSIRGKVPLISWVQAGDFSALVDNYHPGDAEIWIDSVVPVRRHTFALRIKGDSMTPEFNEGEVVIIEPDADAENGSFVVVRNGDAECTLKQLVRDGGAAFLKPMNERYPIYPFPADGVIVGVVKGKMKLY